MTAESARTALQNLLRRHATGVCVVLLCAVVQAFVISQGTWQFNVPERLFGGYYDALGESLRHGRFDVPPDAIGPEAFVIEGRYYGYFGPTPALPRTVLNALFPQMRGRWTRTLMLINSVLTLWATWLIVQEAWAAAQPKKLKLPQSPAWRYISALFLVCVTVGSSLLFITHAVVIYHEASISSVMLAMWASVAVLGYQRTGRLWRLLLACLCALLSFQARASVGAGPMVAVGLLTIAMTLSLALRWLRGRRPPREAVAQSALVAYVPALPTARLAAHVLIAAVGMCALTGGVVYKNLKVLGSITGVPPLRYHVQVGANPTRLARTSGSLLQPRNLRANVYHYLDPYNFNLDPSFPFFSARTEAQMRVFPEARMDNIEPVASVTGINTFFCLIAFVGSLFAFVPHSSVSSGLRRFRLVIAGAAAGCATIFILGALSLRYQHDFFPLLVIAGAAGLRGLFVNYRHSAWARCVVALLAVAAVYTCFANTAVSLSMPRW